jgi:hypothetical protein
MVKPERRTRADLVAAAAIAVVVAVAAALIWWTSDARATISRPAAAPVPDLRSARVVPTSLNQLWTAPSAKTTQPLVVDGSVVTGDGRQVDGRDPVTGAVAWSYARDLELCGVTWVYRYAVAVYPDRRGCGQVSTVEGQTGRRGPARSSYADKRVTLSSDGTTVLSAGAFRLEMWRSDMVRTLSYGAIDAQINPLPKTQKFCSFVSAAASSSAASVLEKCPDKPDLRLTLLKVGKDEDKPDIRYVPEPGVTAESGSRVLAVSETTTAVYIPSPRPQVVVVDEAGTTLAALPLPGPASSPNTAGAVSRAGDLVTWWTGDSVMVFDANQLRYKYTVAAAGPVVPLGPATLMAGRLLIPVTSGIGVYDPATGTNERYIPLNRPPGPGPVVPAVAGSTLLEQRGDTVVALSGK